MLRYIEKTDPLILITCIMAGIVAGFFSIVRGISWLYIAALMGTVLISTLLAYNYHWFAILNILLLSVVKFEPAPSDLLFVLLLIFGIVGGHLDFSRLKNSHIATILFLLYAIISTLQLLFINNQLVGIRYHFITIYLMIFSFYILLYVSCDNIKSILKAYIITSTISAFLGLFGYLGLYPNIFLYDRYRIMGLFKDPNVMGPFLVPSIIMLLDDIWSKKIFYRTFWIHISLIIINLLAIIATFSRGAWVNILVCLLVYFALNIRRIHLKGIDLKRVIIYVLLVAMVISMVWTFIISHEYKQFLYGRLNLQSYDKYRFAVQEKGVILTFINILGYGPGQFEYNVLRQTGMMFSAHNLYIRVMMENGIIGFILFFGSLAIVFYSLIMDYKQGRTYIAMTPACFVAILSGIMVNSLVIDTLHWRHFWFFIGLSMASFVLKVGEKSGDNGIYKLGSGNTL